MHDCAKSYIETFNTKRVPHTISTRSVQLSLPFKQESPLWQQNMSK
jgi:hypothetical protein